MSDLPIQGDSAVIPIRYLICSRLLGGTTRLLLLGALTATLGELLVHTGL